MEKHVIKIDDVLYESAPETKICQGCAFYGDNDRDRCDIAIDQHDCTDNNIIWKQVGVKTESMSKQIGGTHYQKKIQPWDIIREWNLDYWRGNVIKYVLRAPEKNGVEDIKKAIHYLEYVVEHYVKDRK